MTMPFIFTGLEAERAFGPMIKTPEQMRCENERAFLNLRDAISRFGGGGSLGKCTSSVGSIPTALNQYRGK